MVYGWVESPTVVHQPRVRPTSVIGKGQSDSWCHVHPSVWAPDLSSHCSTFSWPTCVENAYRVRPTASMDQANRRDSEQKERKTGAKESSEPVRTKPVVLADIGSGRVLVLPSDRT